MNDSVMKTPLFMARLLFGGSGTPGQAGSDEDGQSPHHITAVTLS